MTPASPAAPQRSRTTARLAAVQALFQCEQNNDAVPTVIEQFIAHRLRIDANAQCEEGEVPFADKRLFTEIVQGASKVRDDLDKRIEGLLPASWPFERLDPVIRALFRAGAYELTQGTPLRVVINEYLDIAHSFFSGDEPRLVNGVLDAFGRELDADKSSGSDTLE